uniref:Reelin domain-containing protein n=1 Tax=Parastrongyloides trichosuri TaxID=131310 RepID=A0A0N4Z7S8_PARTI
MVQFIYFILYILFISNDLIEGLLESKGYGCEMRQSMRLNKRLHGFPQKDQPPFIFQFINANGKHVKTYESNRNYTVRVVGFTRFKGFVIQARATDKEGSMIGSLTEGMFIEDHLWNKLGIQYQSCSKSYPTMDSVTHSNEKQKYIVEVKWRTERDVGPIQFLITIATNDKIYWERWVPISGLINPKQYPSNH